MKQPVIVDLRNIYRPEEMEKGPRFVRRDDSAIKHSI
jgi:hypothetical protein